MANMVSCYYNILRCKHSTCILCFYGTSKLAKVAVSTQGTHTHKHMHAHTHSPFPNARMQGMCIHNFIFLVSMMR